MCGVNTERPLLEKALHALNRIPNSKFLAKNGADSNTYDLASEIHKELSKEQLSTCKCKNN